MDGIVFSMIITMLTTLPIRIIHKTPHPTTIDISNVVLLSRMKIWQHLVNEDFYKHACLRYFMAYGCSKIVLEYTDNQDNLQKIDILPRNANAMIYKFKPGTSLKITMQTQCESIGVYSIGTGILYITGLAI